ncbi:hypothetical protein V0288_23630 [Pannus brasiliensis CCIBt3594]|uniref:Uncharacterized protein n=1 Tax=Pannus brasiliensis CCIBt3594 TaxID=1427578 RepID=A0AAW9QY53_9CHRO
MNLPMQSQPVLRNVSSTAFTESGINPSIDCNAACTMCKSGFPPISVPACIAAAAAHCNCG